jgi:hypothetical protein
MKALIAVVVLVAGLFGLGFLLPAEQWVGRSVAVNAPPEVIYAQVAQPESWRWAPEDVRGSGKLQLTQADPIRGIAYEVSLDREPYKARGAIQWVPSAPATLVIWTWKARYGGPFSRLTGILEGERQGEQFATGLQALKKIAEAAAPAAVPSVPEAPKEPEQPVELPPPVEPGGEAEAVARGEAPPSSPEEPVAAPAQP